MGPRMKKCNRKGWDLLLSLRNFPSRQPRFLREWIWKQLMEKMDIRIISLTKTMHTAQLYCLFARNLGRWKRARPQLHQRVAQVQPMAKDFTSSVAALCECSSRSKLLHQSNPFVLAPSSMQPSFWSQAQVLLSAPGNPLPSVAFQRLGLRNGLCTTPEASLPACPHLPRHL